MSSPLQMSRRRPPSEKPKLVPKVSQPQFLAPPPGASTTPPGSPGRKGTYRVDEEHPPSAPKRKRSASGKKTKRRKSRKSKKIKNKKSKKGTKRR